MLEKLATVGHANHFEKDHHRVSGVVSRRTARDACIPLVGVPPAKQRLVLRTQVLESKAVLEQTNATLYKSRK